MEKFASSLLLISSTSSSLSSFLSSGFFLSSWARNMPGGASAIEREAPRIQRRRFMGLLETCEWHERTGGIAGGASLSKLSGHGNLYFRTRKPHFRLPSPDAGLRTPGTVA